MDMRSTRSFRSKRKAITAGEEEMNIRMGVGPNTVAARATTGTASGALAGQREDCLTRCDHQPEQQRAGHSKDPTMTWVPVATVGALFLLPSTPSSLRSRPAPPEARDRTQRGVWAEPGGARAASRHPRPARGP